MAAAGRHNRQVNFMRPSARRTFQARGFTLVELLAVIAIIALLIGILVPTIGRVRTSARNAKTSSTLSALGTGLETYRADDKLGGQYPPSRSDRGGAGVNQLLATSPFEQNASQSGTDIEISGAALLVWALAGADLLGAPGFRVVDPADPARNTWSHWTHDYLAGGANPAASSGLYARYDNSVPGRVDQPVHPRFGPYVAIDKIGYSKRISGATSLNGLFELENDPTPRAYPMFLDAFDNPILYYRADPAGRHLLDRDVSNELELGVGGSRGTYHWMDNGPLVQSVNSAQQTPLKTDADQTGNHRLGWEDPDSYTSNAPPPPGNFAHYILNKDATAKLTPQRADSYLLISPGPDGIYGSADDVSNFKHNGN